MMPFQNCGLQTGLKNLSSSSSEKSDSGNGGGYEGKPDGTYYHFIPNFTCQGKPAAEQITEIKNGQAYLYGSDDGQCAGVGTPVVATDINVSPFQKEFISVKDSLFKRYDDKPAGIPNNIAEILCRDNFDEPTFEIVSHYDREKNEALTRVYLPESQISDFSVSRILSSSEVRYVGKQISFKVDLSKPAFAEKKYSGVIDASTISGVKAQPLVCVIGGSVDTSKWNLKALTSIDVSSFHVLKNNQIMFFSEVSRTYFSPTLFTYVTHLFKIGVDNVVSDFSKLILGDSYNVVGRIDSDDDNLSFFMAQLNSEIWSSMFVYDSRSGKTKKLTNLKPGADPEAYFLQAPQLTADQFLIYDTQIIRNYGNRTGMVRVYNFKDDSVTDIAGLDNGVDGYSVLQNTNRVLLYWTTKNNIKNVIQIYDAKTKLYTDVVLKLPNTCSVQGYDIRNLNDDDSVLINQVCNGTEISVARAFLTDGHVQVLGANSFISWMSDDRNRIVMTNTAKENTAYDLRTKKATKVPVDPRFGSDSSTSGTTNFILSEQQSRMALVNDRLLYGFGGNTDAPTMYQVDLQTGVSAPICESAIGKKLFLGMLPNQKVFVFTYDATVKVYRFYQAKSLTDCARINEFPSSYPNVPKMIPTNIGFGLLLGNPMSASTHNWTREAVFVPIDGRPPLKFNPDANGNWQMEVSADKNRIVLSGPAADGTTKIFSFDF